MLGLNGSLAYLVVGLLVAGEAELLVGLFVFWPTAMMPSGVLAAPGHANLAVMITVDGAVVGDAAVYSMRRALGPVMSIGRVGRVLALNRWDRAEDIVIRRDWIGVLLGGCFGIPRALVPAVVGMPFRRCLVCNALGGLLWAVAVVLLGYLGGASSTGLERLVAGRWALLVVAVLAVGAVVMTGLRHRPGPTAPERELAAGR